MIEEEFKIEEMRLEDEPSIEEEEIISLKEELKKTTLTKDDMVNSLKEVLKENHEELEETIEEYKNNVEDKNESLKTELEDKIKKLQNSIKTLEKSIDLINIPDISPLATKEEIKAVLAQIEGVKSLIPKDKKLTVNDINGLTDILKGIADRPQPMSQPITLDVLANGVLKKANVARFNFTGATITTQGNTATITPAAASVAWGGITGTLSNQTDLQTALNGKQATLVSGTNIKTVNGVSVLGSGDIPLPNGTSINNVTAGTTTVTATDGTIVYFIDASGGNVTMTMPAAASNTGRYELARVDTSANTVTVTGTVNGVVNPTIPVGDSWTLSSNNSSYRLI